MRGSSGGIHPYPGDPLTDHLIAIFSQRHERAATMVTSNLPFDEWTEVFGSQRLTGVYHNYSLDRNSLPSKG